MGFMEKRGSFTCPICPIMGQFLYCSLELVFYGTQVIKDDINSNFQMFKDDLMKLKVLRL